MASQKTTWTIEGFMLYQFFLSVLQAAFDANFKLIVIRYAKETIRL
jgi:hypothetical protein